MGPGGPTVLAVGRGWAHPPRWAIIALSAATVALATSVTFWLTSAPAPAAGATDGASAQPILTVPAAPTGIRVERPADRPLRVLFIGDSLMYGSFASTDDLTYRGRIVAALEAGGPVSAVQVGGPGEHAANAAVALRKKHGPFDLVFVELGANDSVDITPAKFGKDYRILLDEVRQMAPRAGLVCDGVWNGPEYAIPLDRELRPVCAAHGGLVVPLTGLYVDESLRGPAGSHTADGRVRDQFHPNDLGHAAIAKAMLAVLDL